MKILIRIFLLCFTLLSCQTSEIVSRFIATATPTCALADYSSQDGKIMQRFLDAFQLAQSTLRINLPSVIAEMQAARREHQFITPPSCAKDLHVKVTNAMDASIDAYTFFLQQADTSLVSYQLAKSKQLWDEANRELQRLKDNR